MIRRTRRALIVMLIILFGGAIGGVLADLARGSEYFDWLSYGRSFGISTDNPFILNLGIIDIKLGFMLNLTVAAIVCIIISIVISRRI